MIETSSTLRTAMRGASVEPAIAVTIAPYVGGVRRLRWENVYAGAEPDAPSALAVTGDGAVLRARTAPGSPDDVLYYQRVPAPGPGSAWGSWSSLGSVAAGSGVVLAARGSQALLAFVAPGRREVRLRESSDGGQSWGGSVLVVTAPADVYWLALAIAPSGVVALFYAAGATLYAVQRTGSVWGAPSAWPHSVAQITGVAARAGDDWELAVTGTGSEGHSRVWTVLFGNGTLLDVGVWSGLMELTRANSGSGVVYRGPSLGFTDTRHLAFVEDFAGPVAVKRPFLSHMPAGAGFLQNLWREPAPFNTASAYGVGLAADARWAWSASSNAVWRADLALGALDVSADVLEVVQEAWPARGRVVVTLHNAHGRYTSPGQGELAAWTLGAELRIAWGYRTTAGIETVLGPATWIEGWEQRSGVLGATVRIEASDGWGLLDAWRARRSYVWPAGSTTPAAVLQYLLARAGLALATESVSAFFQTATPAFLVQAGETGAQAMRRLLRRGNDVLFFRGAGALHKSPSPGEATTASYGTDHAVLRALAREGVPEATRVQVFGQGVVTEATDWALAALVDDRTLQVHDRTLTDADQAAARAQAELEQRRREVSWGMLASTPHPGQELYDVVAVTDSALGLSGTRRRVMGWRRRYERGGERSRYEQELFLGPV